MFQTTNNLPLDLAATLGPQLFELSVDCMKLLDGEDRIVAINRNGMDAMDIDNVEQVRGTPWRDLWPESALEALHAALDAARRGATGHFCAPCNTLRGATRWWDVTISALPAGAGQPGMLVVVSRDVTGTRAAREERERLLKELQAANRRMSEVFMRAPAFMCVLGGPQHVFEFVNERFLQLAGSRELVGLPALQAVPELATQGLPALLDAVYDSGEPFAASDMLLRLRRAADGVLEERYVDLVLTALRDADGRVTGLLVHGIDQTHRKLAEIRMHDSRERFEKIVSQAATGVIEMDVNGTFTLVNERFCTMLGYTQAELLGTNVLSVTAPDSVERTASALGGLLATGQGFQIHKHYQRKDGSLISATSSVNAVRGADGDYQGVVAIVLDTTETVRAAEALRASEERYRSLFESMDQAFAMLDVAFDDAGRAVDWRYLETNPAFAQQAGLADAVGKRMRDTSPAPEPWWLDELAAVVRSGQPRRFERESRAGGRWLDVYLGRVGGAGSHKVALLFRDISERKAAEDTLRRLAHDLAEADRRKTEFLATLAHELRNPLAPIRSGLGVMRLNRELPPGMARVREMMERQVSHMVHLIDDLLDVARISGGKLHLRKERVALNSVLASAVETSLPLIEASHHELALALPEAVLTVDADATRIAQVVSNLLNNAAKYTPAGGRLTLSLRREDTARGGEAVITVTDTGIGIPRDALVKVFDMFSQVGGGGERAQGGLGIGLSLVRQLVVMHGGSVAAESDGEGTGSRFTVRLPLVPDALEAQQRAATPADAEPEPASHLRVLVVDDNVDAAVTLSMILELDGYATAVAHSGPQAIELAAGFRPAVVFLDIGMPGMDGYETAAALRALPALDGACLVALTGWGAEHDRARSREAGFAHHLTKPVELGTVRKLLGDIASKPDCGRG